MRLTQDRLCGVNIYSANIWALSESSTLSVWTRSALRHTKLGHCYFWPQVGVSQLHLKPVLSTQISQFQCQTHLGVSFCGFSSVPDPDGGENRGNSAFNTRCQAGTEATAAQYNYHPADKTTSSELIYPRHGQIAAAAFSTTSTVS